MISWPPRRFVWQITSPFTVIAVLLLMVLISQLRILHMMRDSQQHHRQRNEDLHHVICVRQDRLAERLTVTLPSCPAPLPIDRR